MKFTKLLLGVPLVYILILMSSVPITGCMKTNTVHDTTELTIHDTLTIIDTVTACNCTLTDGLIAYYNFNGGNLDDSSGMNNNIFFNNALKTADRFGHANNAYLFDGATSYMQIKNSASLNPDSMTMFAIVKVNGFYTGACGGNQILVKGDSYHTDGFYDMGFYDFTANCGATNINNESFGGSFGNNPFDGAAPYAGTDSIKIKTGQWYYVAITYDGSSIMLYINGQLKSSMNRTAIFTPNASDLFLGKLNDATYPYYFNGVLDEIRIYKRALCPSAIRQLSLVTE